MPWGWYVPTSASRILEVGGCLATCLVLAGCASGPPPLPVEVRVPVATPCITEALSRPDLLTDGALAALDDYRLVLELARDRRLRQGYIAELEAAVAGCR